MTFTQQTQRPTLLADAPDEKRDGAGLGLMPMSPAVRLGLALLRVYLLAMVLMLGDHLLDLAGAFRHGGVR